VTLTFSVLLKTVQTHLCLMLKSNSEFNNMFREDRNMFVGGVCVYVSHSITAKRRTDIEVDSDDMIWLDINVKNQAFIIGVIYRPPSTNHEIWPGRKVSRPYVIHKYWFLYFCDVIYQAFNVGIRGSRGVGSVRPPKRTLSYVFTSTFFPSLFYFLLPPPNKKCLGPRPH